MDRLECKPVCSKTTSLEDVKTSRKSSLPANLTFTNRNDRNWFKDHKWLKVPEEYSIAEPHKIQQLQEWLDSVGNSQTLEDLKVILDWENNKPTCQKGIYIL